MRITPLDIQQKQFATKFRGFDMEEVDSFLELLREEMEELLRDNANLREEARRFEKQLKEYKNIETTLRDTMVKTQEMVEEYKTTAKRDAELVRKEAELEAEKRIQDAQDKVIKMHEDITDLKGVRRHFKEEIRRLIERYARELEFDKEREEDTPDEIQNP
jgi:cell division initiation protein